jgi:Reverse transcriptase (RNA-dependent DNA polymerase)/zinc-binding in reverse transcriptase/Endonuclease/Exonuclease/phosphatase family
MNILAWNCRGGRGPRRKQFLRSLLNATRADIVFVSETKSSRRKSVAFLQTLPLQNFDLVPSNGLSGGLWLIWGSHIQIRVFEKNKNYFFAWVQTRDKPPWLLVCVYGDASYRDNPRIWRDIRGLTTLNAPLCCIGDFNAIMDIEEKHGGNRRLNQNGVGFRNFLFDAELIDLGFKGPAYTWTNRPHASNAIFVRLDRIVANSAWCNLYPQAYVNHMPRAQSDHCPILLRTKNIIRQNKGFKIEHWWFSEARFADAWEGKWIASTEVGWDKKFREMKANIIKWSHNLETPQRAVHRLREEIFNIQKMHPNSQNHTKEAQLQLELKGAEDKLNDYWYQRSRVQWATDGDNNTKFFHATATQRRRRNDIAGITDENGVHQTEERQIAKVFVSYFKKLYSAKEATVHDRHTSISFFNKLTTPSAKRIPVAAHHKMVSIPTGQEIRDTLLMLGPDKAPGPDGLTARMIQRHWHVFEADICKIIQQAFQNCEAPREWMNCQMVLIPKKAEPVTPMDYRPISLGNVLYRLFAKIITNRLQPFMSRVISREQTTFIRGRSISDNTILMREIIHSFNTRDHRDESFALKADINKAFDMLEWAFIEKALTAIGAPDKLVKLIISCLQAGKVTVLVNGSGTDFITPTRGLRQDCPLSPYLFITSTEFLSRSIQLAVQEGRIGGIQIAPTAPLITHALYADDLVIFGRAHMAEVSCLAQLLDEFGKHSGLIINPQKSTLWFSQGCGNECKERIMRAMNARRADENEKYLGVYLPTKVRMKDRTHDLMIDLFWDRFGGWKLNLLSHPGRMVLIKSVLSALPVYYMSIAPMPVKTTTQLTGLMRRFFWGKLDKSRYLAYVSWDTIGRAKQEGGLQIKEIRTMNDALLLKLVWQMAQGKDKIWIEVMQAKYCPNEGIWGARPMTGVSLLWRKILSLREVLKEDVQWNIGSGTDIRVYNQPWVEGWENIRPNEDIQSNPTLNQMKNPVNGCWDTAKLSNVLGHDMTSWVIANIQPPNENNPLKDRLIWSRAKSGRYSVKEGYSMMKAGPVDIRENERRMWTLLWQVKGIIPRVRVFIWRACHNAIATTYEMHRRIHAIDPICPRCHGENEYIMHCLFFCPSSRAAWFVSDVSIRVENLPLRFKECMVQFFTTLTPEQIIKALNMLWCV